MNPAIQARPANSPHTPRRACSSPSRFLLSLLLLIVALSSCDDEGAASPTDTGNPGDTTEEAEDISSLSDTGSSSTGTADAIDDTGSGTTEESYDCDDPHPSWLFCEDFESGDGDWESWFAESEFLTAVGGSNRGRIDLSDEHRRSGDWAVYMGGDNEHHRGADLVWYACDGEQRVNCDLRGYDRLYFRTWVRFAEDHNYVHHFLGIRGLDRFWEYGGAGCLPNGETTMGTTVDFSRNTHETFFYTYHLDMGCDGNCGNYMDVAARCQHCDDIGMPTCQEREQCCWGNNLRPDSPAALPVGEWFCFEMMMEANTPGEADGEMAYWINEDLGHQVDGMRWRISEALQLNRVRLQHYIASSDQPQRVWFDDVVVSTERIGCH